MIVYAERDMLVRAVDEDAHEDEHCFRFGSMDSTFQKFGDMPYEKDRPLDDPLTLMNFKRKL